MKQPQEIEVWYIIPALRRKIARCMVQKHQLSQRKTAKLLDITESAVSQYINEKRAKDVSLGCEVVQKIDRVSQKIVEGQSNFTTEIQKLLKIVRKKGILCKIHKLHDNLPEDCNYCEFN